MLQDMEGGGGQMLLAEIVLKFRRQSVEMSRKKGSTYVRE